MSVRTLPLLSLIVLAGLCAATLSGCRVAEVSDETEASAEPNPAFTIQRVDGITIDGGFDDWAKGPTPGKRKGLTVPIYADEDGRFVAADDLDVLASIGWDDQGLLIRLDVTDDRVMGTQDLSTLDTSNSEAVAIDDALSLVVSTLEHDYQMLWVWFAPTKDGGSVQAHVARQPQKGWEGGEAPDPTIEATGGMTDNGWRLEARVSWSNFPVNRSAGGTIGLQLEVRDVDAQRQTPPSDEPLLAVWRPNAHARHDPANTFRVELVGPDSPGTQVCPIVTRVPHRAQGPELLAIAPAEYAGREAAFVTASGQLGQATFVAEAGRAVARQDVVFDDPPKRPRAVRVDVEGVTSAPFHQPVLPAPMPVDGQWLLGSRIQRTMTLLATSTPTDPNRVRVLCYGQSIVGGSWWKTLEEDLRRRFPHAQLQIVNRAIGGWGGEALIRTAEHDVYPFYPDLIIMHFYGGSEGTLEQMIRNIRRRTTAEIMLWTHHPIAWDKGYMGPSIWREIGQRNNCEIVEVRGAWNRFMKRHDLQIKDLLRDVVHPNRDGNRLLAQLVGRHMQYHTFAEAGWANRVKRYEARRPIEERTGDEVSFTGDPWPAQEAKFVYMPETTVLMGQSPDSALELTFTGNRVDVIPGPFRGKRVGTAKILIDGKPPSEHPGCYAITRTSIFDRWWPGVRRVAHDKPLLLEDWALHVTGVDTEADRFTFHVIGSETGADGEGVSDERFVSDSGRVVIEPRDIQMPIDQLAALANKAEQGEPIASVTWQVVPMFEDTYAPFADRTEALQRSGGKKKSLGSDAYFITVAQGLTNGEHTLRIVPNGDGPVPVRMIVAHEPPLK